MKEQEIRVIWERSGFTGRFSETIVVQFVLPQVLVDILVRR
ncbi:MAG: hypothetical protein WBV73_04380 [Phormidium sp.]